MKRANYLAIFISLVSLTACQGPAGPAGEDGTSCTVTSNGDGSQTISCADGTSVTVNNGADGQDGSDGTSCTVVQNEDGTKTISCTDGTEVTVSDGEDGADGQDGVDGQDGANYNAAAAAEPESCATCHEGIGEQHQAVYDQYADTAALSLTIDGVVSTANGDGTYNATMTVTILNGGEPYLDGDGLPSLDQKRFYTVTYDSATRDFENSKSFSNPVSIGGGQYTVTATGLAYAPELSNAQAYAYIADGKLESEGMQLYDDVSNAGLAYGDAGSYVSSANVAGCESCHGSPYMKHGYRAASVDGLADFAACKSCHFDSKQGGHEDWQILVDDPLRYAELHDGADLTDDEETRYAYKAKVMNDVHMSHAMEFPYPQSMANCATCHEGKLDMVLTDANFTPETCKSCHAVTGSEEYETATHALKTLWTNAGVLELHLDTDPNDEDGILDSCNGCHRESGGAPAFSAIHSGYNKEIYAAADGTRYSELFTASVDSASLAGNVLTVTFSVAEDPASTLEADPADIVPTLIIGLYGYDTKDYIVSAHSKDEDGYRLLEYVVDGTTENPRFTTVAAAGGSWTITVDLTLWADMIADRTIRRAEIGVMPQLKDAAGTTVALDAPSRTFDLAANAFDDDYFTDIVDVKDGCNSCHDALATTFHSANRGGNIRVCRMCHESSSGGSHLEMQSRSIDSYVHAVHSFQAFDPGDVDFTDPVERVRYELHVEHVYPNFTAKNCESCHIPGTYDVPDQSKSLPGLLSGSDTLNVDRNIGSVPAYVTGPGARACGACHRALMINEDDADELSSFYQHTGTNGYLVEDDDGVWETVVAKIMSYFE